MTKAQNEWIKKHGSKITRYIEANYPLTDDQWQDVLNYCSECFHISKNNKEVMEALFDIIEPWDVKQWKEFKNV